MNRRSTPPAPTPVRVQHEAKRIKCAATLKDTLILLANQGTAVTTIYHGLRITLVPDAWFALYRLYGVVGKNEILTICNMAKAAGLALNPLDAKPGAIKNTVVWQLKQIQL